MAKSKSKIILSRAAFFVFLLVAQLFSCNMKENKVNETGAIDTVTSTSEVGSYTLEKFEWLLGDWSNEAKGQMIGENWTKINDSLFKGNGFGLKGTDTIFRESLQIIIMDSSVYYVPTVSGQNDNQPVLFKMTDVGENYFISENKNHDFPQLIRYKLEAPGVLLAAIEGKLNGRETKREFRFRRSTIRLMP